MEKFSLRIVFLVLGSGMAVDRISFAQVSPPTISKAFGAVTVPLLVPTSLTFSITNPNSIASLTGVGFTDSLPTTMVVATPNGLAGSCGGGTITATAGSTTITLSGAALAGSESCTFSVNVLDLVSGGVKVNSVTVTSANGGTGNTASASITVITPVLATKAFGAATIPLNSTTSLTFSVTNTNATIGLTGISLLDALPAGLVVATPSGLTGSCGGGTITATADSTTITLSGATLAGNGSCTFSVNVTGTTQGVKDNSVQVTSNETGGAGVPASITVLTTTATPTNTPTNTPTPVVVVPTLNDSGMLIFGLLIAAAGLLLLVRRR